MDINNEYDKLKTLVLEKIPDTFTINNNLIEERPYDASFMPLNLNPYRQEGGYYPIRCFFTPRTYVGREPLYQMTKGEETTIRMWNAIIQYEEYDLLADLLILGFLHDCLEKEIIKPRRGRGRFYITEYRTSHHSIAGNFYTVDDMHKLIAKARSVLEENNYGKHDPRCKTYLTMLDGAMCRKYSNKAWKDELEVHNTEDLARIMMEIIVDEYGSRYFIIKCPNDQSIARADRIHSRAVNASFDEWVQEGEKLYRK